MDVSVVMVIMNSILKVEWVWFFITIALIMSIRRSMGSMVDLWCLVNKIVRIMMFNRYRYTINSPRHNNTNRGSIVGIMMNNSSNVMNRVVKLRVNTFDNAMVFSSHW